MEPPSQQPSDAASASAPGGVPNTRQKPGGGLRLRLSSFLVFVLCAFGLLLAGPLAWYNYSRSTEAALEVASETMGRAASNVSLRTRLLAQPFAFLTEHIPTLPGAAAAPKGFEHPLLPALIGIMADTPQMYSAFFGYPDGGFLQVISVAGNPAVAAWLKAPEGTRLALRAISVQAGGAAWSVGATWTAPIPSSARPSRPRRTTTRAPAPGTPWPRARCTPCARTSTCSAAPATWA